MRPMNRKLGALAAGTLAVLAVAQYVTDQADPPSSSYAPGTLMCRSIDARGTPTGCVPIDPAHYGFAAMRGM